MRTVRCPDDDQVATVADGFAAVLIERSGWEPVDDAGAVTLSPDGFPLDVVTGDVDQDDDLVDLADLTPDQLAELAELSTDPHRSDTPEEG